MPTIDELYWETRYHKRETGWDIGSASDPIINFAHELGHKNASILIPGCGNAHEVDTLLNLGFEDISVIDFATVPLKELAKRQAEAVESGRLKIFCGDFFEHKGSYDLILEQTFFCAINPGQRQLYAQKMNELLKPKAKLAGLLFNFEFPLEGPPFGGSKEEYHEHFSPYFKILTMEPCQNSIKPRLGKELIFILQKPELVLI
ncbi:MAG: SAM-dependent methyltransferase [bacterium]|nr:SAM-dependent methyltransferase [bacterium]